MVSLPRHTATGTSQPRHKNDRHRTWMMEQALMHMVREGNLDYKKVLEQSARISDGVPVKVRDSLQRYYADDALCACSHWGWLDAGCCLHGGG